MLKVVCPGKSDLFIAVIKDNSRFASIRVYCYKAAVFVLLVRNEHFGYIPLLPLNSMFVAPKCFESGVINVRIHLYVFLSKLVIPTRPRDGRNKHISQTLHLYNNTSPTAYFFFKL